MKRIIAFVKDSQGSIIAFTALFLFVAVGLLAVVIDVGHLHAVKNQLANAADASALAGCRALFPKDNYPFIPVVNPPYCFVPDGAVDTAIKTAKLNFTDGDKSITVVEEDVVLGWWEWDKTKPKYQEFTPHPGMCDVSVINAVKVTTRRRGDLSQGSVIMGFAKALGFDTLNPSASAVAAVGYISSMPPGAAPGGFVAPHTRFLTWIWERHKDNPDHLNLPESQLFDDKSLFYMLLNPAKGKTQIEPPIFAQADNAGWVSEGDAHPTPGYVQDMIDKGTTFPITVGQTPLVLDNGKVGESVLGYLQDAVGGKNAAGPDYVGTTPKDFWVPSVTSDSFNEKGITSDNMWNIQITNAWKPNKMPDDLQLSVGMDKTVGVIQFRLKEPMYVQGAGPGGPPSNANADIPRLVWTDSNLIVK